MATKRQKGSLTDDPLGPVVGKNLRAALQQAGLSNREAARQLRELARELGMTEEAVATVRGRTLDYITREEQRNCRQSVLEGLVKVIAHPSVTEAWLRGEEGFRFAGNRTSRDFGGLGWTAGGPELPAESQFVLDGFMSRCHGALMRDAEKGLGTQQAAKEWYHREGWRILTCLVQLLDREAWQAILIDDKSREHLPPEDTSTALAAAFERMLAPWIEGHVHLNLPMLCDLIELQSAAMWPQTVIPGGLGPLRDMIQESTS